MPYPELAFYTANAQTLRHVAHCLSCGAIRPSMTAKGNTSTCALAVITILGTVAILLSAIGPAGLAGYPVAHRIARARSACA
jgi:hypothetical protein